MAGVAREQPADVPQLKALLAPLRGNDLLAGQPASWQRQE
jgi:hypothetical protein